VTNTLVIPWGAVAAMTLDLPHIWWVHEYGLHDHGLDFFYGFERTLEIVRESSTHVVANSKAVKDALFGGAGPEKCSVATYRVALNEPVKHDQVHFRHEHALKLVLTGVVTESKGQGDAIRAVGKLVAVGYDVELCVVGSMDVSPAYCSALRDLVAEEGLAERIRFVGLLDNTRPVVEEADVSLTCSRREAFGRVTAEAMLLGKPVIGTDTGGTPELVDDGVSGLLYPPGDVDRLCDHIAFFADHRPEIRAFGDRARSLIGEKLSENPVDSVMFDLGQRYKDGMNPHSRLLMRLALGWREGGQMRMETRLREMERVQSSHQREVTELRARLAASEAHAADLQARLEAVAASVSWRLAAPVRRAGAVLRRRPRR
jgi:hypothetical protein